MRPRRLTRIITDPYTQPAVAIPWPTTGEGPVGQGTLSHTVECPVGGGGLAPAPGLRRVLVGGVGYRNLRDMSAGPELIERLRALEWPADVEIEDLSFGAVHVLHWLQEHPSFDALVLVAAVARGRPPGSVTRVMWTAPPVTGEAVQAAIAEAVTGVIGLDTLLIVLGYFAALPPRVIVFELEPRDDDWGPDFSPLVQSALEQSVRLVEAEVHALIQ